MIFAVIEEFLVVIIFKIAEICSQLPFSKILVVTPDFWMLLLYYAVVSGFVFLFNKRKIRVLRFLLGNQMSQIVRKYKKKMIAFCLILVMIFYLVRWLPQDLRIYFVDVGQRRLLCYQKSRRKDSNN